MTSNERFNRCCRPADATAFRASGAWSDVTIIDALRMRCIDASDRTALVDGGITLSFAALRADSETVAQMLSESGIGPGDVVSMQLPNWHEATLLIIATAMIGAVINPIVPIYRDTEVGFILEDAGARLLAVPKVFRGFDYQAMAARLTASGRFKGEVLTFRDGGTQGSIVSSTRATGEHSTHFKPVTPDAVRLLMYTSGTTGRAKGVMHSSNTLAAELAAVIGYWGVSRDDVILMPSPLTHITGYLYGVELPIRTGAKAVLMERWDPDRAIDLIEELGVTLMVGATPFLSELIDRAAIRRTHLPTLRLFACGGAPVPPEVIHRAHRAFTNCLATRVYGSTEAPTITLGVKSRSEQAAAAETEGRVVGHEIRLLGADGHEVSPGQEGEIVSRGPELFLGYLRVDDEKDAFTPDGFFRTGDLARMDPQGNLVITGRKKDLIIRGGENIASKEVEDVLFASPQVADAAVVAMPSERMGETVCAFIVSREGTKLTAATLLDHVAASGIARQKWPEAFVFVESLPKTAAGKVRKDVLRARIAESVQVRRGLRPTK